MNRNVERKVPLVFPHGHLNFEPVFTMNKKIKLYKPLFETKRTLAIVPLRLGLGIVMAAHGAQKLFGWFGGYGLQGTGQFFADSLGLAPGVLMAALAGGTEFFGGLLILAGLLTRVAGLGVAVVMAIAILTVHTGAFFSGNNGMEYPLTLLLASLTLVIGGGGAYSLDYDLARLKQQSSS